MNQRTKILLGLLGLLLLVLGWVLWRNSQQTESGTAELSPVEQTLTTRLKQLEAVDFSLDVLNSEAFQGYRQYGELPVKVGSSGRRNPFQPF